MDIDYMPIIEIRVNQLAKQIAGSICSQELGEMIEKKITEEFKKILLNIDSYLSELIITEIDNCVIKSVRNYFTIGSKGYEKINNKVIKLLEKELNND